MYKRQVCSFAAKATEKIVGWCQEIRCNAFFVETAVNDHNRVALETGRCAEALVRILSEAVPDVAIVFADVPSVRARRPVDFGPGHTAAPRR